MTLQETEGRVAVIFSMYDDTNSSNDDIIEHIFSLCQHAHISAGDCLKLGKFDEAFAHLSRAEEALDESRSDRKVFESPYGMSSDVVETVRTLRQRSLHIMRQFEDYRTGKKGGGGSASATRGGSARGAGSLSSLTSRLGEGGLGSSSGHVIGSGKLLAPIPPASSQASRPRFMQPRSSQANDYGTRLSSLEDGSNSWKNGLRGISSIVDGDYHQQSSSSLVTPGPPPQTHRPATSSSTLRQSSRFFQGGGGGTSAYQKEQPHSARARVPTTTTTTAGTSSFRRYQQRGFDDFEEQDDNSFEDNTAEQPNVDDRLAREERGGRPTRAVRGGGASSPLRYEGRGDDGDVMHSLEDPEFAEEQKIKAELEAARQRYLEKQQRQKEEGRCTSPFSRDSQMHQDREDSMIRALKAQKAANEVSRHMDERNARREQMKRAKLDQAEQEQAKHQMQTSKEIEMRREEAAKRREEVESKLIELQKEAAAKTAQRKAKAEARLASQRFNNRTPRSAGGSAGTSPLNNANPSSPSVGGGLHDEPSVSSPLRRDETEALVADNTTALEDQIRRRQKEEEENNRLVIASSSSSDDETHATTKRRQKSGEGQEEGGNEEIIDPRYQSVAPLAPSLSEQHPMYGVFNSGAAAGGRTNNPPPPVEQMSRLDKVHRKIHEMQKMKELQQQQQQQGGGKSLRGRIADNSPPTASKKGGSTGALGITPAGGKSSILSGIMGSGGGGGGSTTESAFDLSVSDGYVEDLLGPNIGAPTIGYEALDLKKQMATIRLQKFARSIKAKKILREKQKKRDFYIDHDLRQHAAFHVVVRAMKLLAAKVTVARVRQRIAHLNEQRIDLEMKARQTQWQSSPVRNRRSSTDPLDVLGMSSGSDTMNNTSNFGPGSPIHAKNSFVMRKNRSIARMSMLQREGSPTLNSSGNSSNHPSLGRLMIPKPSFTNPFKKGHRRHDRMSEIQANVAAITIQQFFRGYRQYSFEQDVKEMRHLIAFATKKTTIPPGKKNFRNASLSMTSYNEDALTSAAASAVATAEEPTFVIGQPTIGFEEASSTSAATTTHQAPPSPAWLAIKAAHASSSDDVPVEEEEDKNDDGNATHNNSSPAEPEYKRRPDLPFAPLKHVDLEVLAREEKERQEAARKKKQQEEEAHQREVERRRNDIQRAIARSCFFQRTCRAFQVRLRLAAQWQRVVVREGVHANFGRKMSQTFLSPMGKTALSGMIGSGRNLEEEWEDSYGSRNREFNGLSHQVQEEVRNIIGSRNPHLLPEFREMYEKKRTRASTTLTAAMRCIQSQLIRWNLQRHAAASKIQKQWRDSKSTHQATVKMLTTHRSELTKVITPGGLL